MKNKDEFLKTDIEATNIAPLLKNALIANGLTTVGKIIALNRHEIQMLRNFGKKRIEALNEFLKEHNLELKGF